jgi:Uma2 family endonuclease
MNAALRNAIYEDLLQVPDTLIAEIIGGELITSPRPASAHALATGAIHQEIGPFARRLREGGGPGGWWILFEPELHLGPDILVPDLAGWRRERLPVLRNVPYFELAPDWVCEVLSTTTARIDRVRKKPLYARERVSHLWLVDPVVRTLEVYRLDGGQWVDAGAYGGAEVIRAEPFATVEMDMSQWWIPGEEETLEKL